MRSVCLDSSAHRGPRPACGSRSRRVATALALALLAVSIVAGCTGGNCMPAKAPEWTYELPQEKDAIYAVGVCEKTWKPQDGLDIATENARAELGRTIESKVRSVLVNSFRGSGGASSEYVSEVAANVSDTVLNGSQRVAWWHDQRGATGVAGRTYVLVKLSRSATVDQIADVARQKAKTSDVKVTEADIKKAFEDLDRELEKRMQ